MNPVVRGFLAVIGGVAAAFLLIFVIQKINTSLYPPPADARNIESIKDVMAAIPLASKLFILVSYAAGSVAGGWVAARYAPRSKMAHAMTVAALLFCFGLINLTTIPHPAWFWVASSAIYWLGAWSGAQAAGA